MKNSRSKKAKSQKKSGFFMKKLSEIAEILRILASYENIKVHKFAV